jgi:hypothetical protein
MCISLATRSVSFPLPSSPHWVPTTTVAGTWVQASRCGVRTRLAPCGASSNGSARLACGSPGETVGAIGAGLHRLVGVTHMNVELVNDGPLTLLIDV